MMRISSELIALPYYIYIIQELFPALLLALLLVGEVQHAHVAELNACTMTEEANVASLVEHTGMVAMVHGIGILVTTIGSHIVALAGFADVSVHNHFSVDSYSDVVTHYANLFGTPFAQRLVLDTLGGDDAIYRPMHLILVKTSIDRIVMIQNL